MKGVWILPFEGKLHKLQGPGKTSCGCVRSEAALRPTFCFLQPLSEWGDAPECGGTSGVGGVGKAEKTSPGDNSARSPSFALLSFGEVSMAQCREVFNFYGEIKNK